ncbi:PAS domain-containing sensor histidine kinase [Haloferula sp. BvORR071]|uniref:PAS domain-containing sensor histidine kinase n=1 Tax=Haloferula sp. BvORR071 TaxID=1396141 RepID=UPI000559536F|nr:PAS domain-containing sensor histidine kinase [Haloferula sp. BvORR071]
MSQEESGGLVEDFEDFFENALCGYATIAADGQILRANSRLAGWLGMAADDLKGLRFSSLLTIGGKIFLETHLAPLLRMQGHFDEVALELVGQNGSRLPVLVNAVERRNAAGELLFTRLTAYRASERRSYERNLLASKNLAENSLLSERDTAVLREQFIAALGHDLRNPLGAITMGVVILANATLSERQQKLLATMDRSAKRMSELIENLMDFARARLGGGMVLDRTLVDLEPVLRHVIDELGTAHPKKTIEVEIAGPLQVDCDPARVAQIASNLVANALVHGAQDQSVKIHSSLSDGYFELCVCNQGKPISPETLKVLFQPFTREEVRSSQNGLGLGLYIAAEVAKAHEGTLEASSTGAETCFTFRMPLR